MSRHHRRPPSNGSNSSNQNSLPSPLHSSYSNTPSVTLAGKLIFFTKNSRCGSKLDSWHKHCPWAIKATAVIPGATLSRLNAKTLSGILSPVSQRATYHHRSVHGPHTNSHMHGNNYLNTSTYSTNSTTPGIPCHHPSSPGTQTRRFCHRG